MAGCQTEVLSLGSHKVSGNPEASGGCTPCFSGLAWAEPGEEVVKLSSGGCITPCGIDAVSAVGKNTKHSFEVQDTQMQFWLLNSALCSRLHHGGYHWLTTFNAMRDEETKSQGSPSPGAVWVLSFTLGARPPQFPALTGGSGSHCPARSWTISSWQDTRETVG